METLVLTLDIIAFVIVVYFSFKSEKSPGKSELGPFAIKVDVPAVSAPAKPPMPKRMIRGL